jgi:hypothetical protein
MPKAEQLPSALAELAPRRALEVGNERFDYDMDKLIGRLEQEAQLAPGVPQATSELSVPDAEFKASGQIG